jgi:hypothetical protein
VWCQAFVEEPVHLLLRGMRLVPGHEDGAGGMLQRPGQQVAAVWPVPFLVLGVREEAVRLVEQGIYLVEIGHELSAASGSAFSIDHVG